MLRVIGVGYNGNYQGGPHKCDFPEAKGQARCGCVHAEQNAIAKSSFAIGLVAFTTTVPCSLCAKQLFNAGIRKVVTVISSDDEYSKPTEFRVNSVALMKEMGMSLIFHNINELQDLIGHIVDIMKIIGPDTACGSTQK
jgi:dCMP deaminase